MTTLLPSCPLLVITNAFYPGYVHHMAKNAAGALRYYLINNSSNSLSKGSTKFIVRYELNMYNIH